MRFQWEMGRLLLAVAASVAVCGCSSDPPTAGPPKERVSGEVLLNGQPLPEGQIQFIDTQGEPPLRYVADIKDGSFSVESTSGKKRVEIRAFRGGNTVPKPGEDPQYLPVEYNERSTLTADIQEGKQTDGLKFELSGAAK